MSTDLISEIRRARENLRYRQREASEAGFTLKMCRSAEKKAAAELDTLLDELETGQSRYMLPGFDRFDLPDSNGNGTADEHQRGPTQFPIAWASRDLDRAMEAACGSRPKGMDDPWPALHEHGCDDAKILEVLAPSGRASRATTAI